MKHIRQQTASNKTERNGQMIKRPNQNENDIQSDKISDRKVFETAIASLCELNQ